MNNHVVNQSRILELDGIRGVAVLAVVLYHYAVIGPGAPFHTFLYWGRAAFRLGWSGVDLILCALRISDRWNPLRRSDVQPLFSDLLCAAIVSNFAFVLCLVEPFSTRCFFLFPMGPSVLASRPSIIFTLVAPLRFLADAYLSVPHFGPDSRMVLVGADLVPGH